MECVGEILADAGEALAACGAGQAVLQGADRLLWVIEKAAQWSMQPPIDEYVEPGSTSQLTRPLPWVFFIILLIFMRICREAYNIVAILMGLDEIRPSQIVKYIQSKRRHLRAVKYQGMRSIRSRGGGGGGGGDGGGGGGGTTRWSRALAAVQGMACLSAASSTSPATHDDHEHQVAVVKMVGGNKTRSERQDGNQGSDGGEEDDDVDEDEVYKEFLYDEKTNSETEDPDFTITDKPCAPDTSATSIESNETNNSDFLSGQSTPNKENQSPHENQLWLANHSLVEDNDKVSKSTSPERAAMNGPVKTKLPTPKDSTKQVLESERRKSVENSHVNEVKKEKEKRRETNKENSKRNRSSPRKSRIANGSPKKISPLKHKSTEIPAVKVTNTEESDEDDLQRKDHKDF